MMQINCLWCGVRDEPEFICGGTTAISRPGADSSDPAWAEYLFFRDNPAGIHHERWYHADGCGQWFNLVRNTQSHEILAVYGISERAP